MAAAVRSTSTVSSGTRSNTTFTAPAGIANDDVLLIIMLIGATSGGTTATAPSGFSTLTGFPMAYDADGDTWVVRCYAWYKIASSESGSYATTHSSASTEGIMYAISGGDATPINPNPTTASDDDGSGSGNVLTAPSITPVVNDSVIVWFGATWDDFGAATPPTGTTPTFTERLNVNPGSVLYIADGVLATAGATGDKSVTSTQGVNKPNICGLICIEASAGGGGGGDAVPVCWVSFRARRV